MRRNELELLPLVTIVTPSFNQGKFIRETINSVLAQDYPRIEYLIIDGGSTDETLDILKEYDGKIKWISEKDNGQTEAINKGWKMGKGEILAWLNSDDTYLPGAVCKAVDFLCANKEFIMVYGEGWHIDESGNVIERYPTEPFNFNRLAETCFICQPTAFICREALEQVGFLDERLNYCMDYDYWIRIGKKHRIGYINEFLANSRLHTETKTLGQRTNVQKEVMQTLFHHFGLVPSNWIFSYCDALIESKFRIKYKAKIIYVIMAIFLFVITSLRYNKKINMSEIACFIIWIKKVIKK